MLYDCGLTNSPSRFPYNIDWINGMVSVNNTRVIIDSAWFVSYTGYHVLQFNEQVAQTLNLPQWPIPTLQSSQWPIPTLHSSQWPFPTLHSSQWSIPTLHSSQWPIPTLHSSQWSIPTLHSSQWSIPTLHSSQWPIPTEAEVHQRGAAYLSLDSPRIPPHTVTSYTLTRRY